MYANTHPAPTLDQALRALGYGHKSGNDKGREIFKLATGEPVGIFDAKDAWVFVASHTK